MTQKHNNLRHLYSAHAEFVNLAPDQPPRRIVAGIILIIVGFVYGLPVLTSVFGFGVAPEDLREGTSRGGLTAQLLAFLAPLLALVFVVRIVERHNLKSLFVPHTRLLGGLWACFRSVCLMLLVLNFTFFWPGTDNLIEARPLAGWLLFAPVAIAVIALQVSTEELIFRGWLQQRLARLNPSPLVWMALPSAFFGILHFFNADTPSEGVTWAIFGTLLALAASDLTARHGTVGPAIGLHLANNLFAFMLFGEENAAATGFALLLLVENESNPPLFSLIWGFEALFTGFFLLILWLAARIGMRR